MNIRLSIAAIVTAGILIAAPSASFAWTYCVEFDDTFPSNARQTPALRFVIEVRVGGGREQQYATVRPTKVGTFHRVRARSYPMTADREVCARSEDFADFVKAQSGRDDVEIGYIYAEMSAGRTGCPYSDGADKRVTASRVLPKSYMTVAFGKVTTQPVDDDSLVFFCFLTLVSARLLSE